MKNVIFVALFLILSFAFQGARAQNRPNTRSNCFTIAGRNLCIGQQAVTIDPRFRRNRRIWGTVSAINPQTKIVEVNFQGNTLNFDFNDAESARALRTREESNGYDTFRVGMGVVACNFDKNGSRLNYPSVVVRNLTYCWDDASSGRILGVFRNLFEGQEDAPLYAILDNEDRLRFTYFLAPLLLSSPGAVPLLDLAMQLKDSVHSAAVLPMAGAVEIESHVMGINDLGKCVQFCQREFQQHRRCISIGFERDDALHTAQCRLYRHSNPATSLSTPLLTLTFYERQGGGASIELAGEDSRPTIPAVHLDRPGSAGARFSFFSRQINPAGALFLDNNQLRFFEDAFLYPALYVRVFSHSVLQNINTWIQGHSENYMFPTSGVLNLYSYLDTPMARDASSPEQCESACTREGSGCLGFYFKVKPYSTFDASPLNNSLKVHECKLIRSAALASSSENSDRGSPNETVTLDNLVNTTRSLVAVKTCAAGAGQQIMSLMPGGHCNGSMNTTAIGASTENRGSPRSVTLVPAGATPVPITNDRTFVGTDIPEFDLDHFVFQDASLSARQLCKQSCIRYNSTHGSIACNAFSLQTFSDSNSALCWIKHLPPSAVVLDARNHIAITSSIMTNPRRVSLTILPSLVQSNILVDVVGQCQQCSPDTVNNAARREVHQNAVFDGYTFERHQILRRPQLTNVMDQCIGYCQERSQLGCVAVRLTQMNSAGSVWNCALQSLPVDGVAQPRRVTPSRQRPLVISVRIH